MKKILLFLLLSTISIVGINAQAIGGGAGVCEVDADPNTITDLQVQDIRYECLVSFDAATGTLYIYDDSRAAGDKWIDYSLTTPDEDTRYDNLRVDAGNLAWDIVDVQTNTVVSSHTIPILDIAPIQSVTSANTDITITTDANGDVLVTNNVIGETTLVEDTDDIDLTLTGTTIKADVIIDSDAANIITSSAAGLKATERQTVTGGNGITVTATGDDFLIDDDDHSKGEFKNHSDAAAGGVLIGEVFTTSTDNTMGISAGIDVKRKY